MTDTSTIKGRPQMNVMPHRQGKYYVRYYDGMETGLMPRSEARSLAKIFGGWVRREWWWQQ